MLRQWLQALSHLHYAYRQARVLENDQELSRLPDDLLENAEVLADGENLRVEQMHRSNYANGGDEVPPGLQSVMLTGRQIAAPGEDPILGAIHDVLVGDSGAARAAAPDAALAAPVAAAAAVRPAPVQVAVQRTALNEFVSQEEIILGGWADLFLLGRKLPGSGSVPQAFSRHLLHQFDQRFARNMDLVFLLFNQLQRHSTCRGVQVMVKGRLFQQFQNLIHADGFQARLEAAIQSPNLPDAKALLAEVRHLASLSGASVPWSPTERSRVLSKLFALSNFFGLPSWFVTISPADMDSPFVIRISQSPLPVVRPLAELPIPSLALRAAIVNANPALAAWYYKLIVETFFSVLVGMAPEDGLRAAPPPLRTRRNGILSLPLAFGAVTETQGRGTLHIHTVVFTVLSPALMQRLLGDPEMRQRVCTKVDSIIRCHLPDPIWTADVLAERDRLRSPATVIPYGNWGDAHLLARMVNVHSHTITCHKSVVGNVMCRLLMPRAEHVLQTCFLRIRYNSQANTFDIEYFLEGREPPLPDPDPLYNPAADSRRILMLLQHRPTVGGGPAEPGRPGPNGFVVSLSELITSLYKCNTDVEVLALPQESLCAMWYLSKYLSKDAVALANVLSLLHKARADIAVRPSVAEDSGQPRRTAQHLLSRIINLASGAQEVSSQMACAALLGMDSFVCSHKFWYAFAWAAVQYVMQQLGDDDADPEHDEDEDEGEEDGASDDFAEPAGRDDDLEAGVPEPGDAPLHRAAGGQLISVPQHIHYAFRGEPLREYSFYEYCAAVLVIPIRRPAGAEEAGDEEAAAGLEEADEAAEAPAQGRRGMLARSCPLLNG